MKRYQLFEFEDQEWFDADFRNSITQFLNIVIMKLKLYHAAVPRIQRVLKKTKENRILDLCSGAAGPIASIYQLLEKRGWQGKITITDKYPNIEIFKHIANQSKGKIDYLSESVDAINTPENLLGMRTFFTSFHHFDAVYAKKILQNAVESKVPIAIFELTERRWINILVAAFLSPIALCLATPFIETVSLKKLFWTYAIPIIPLTFAWDGIVSHMRSYTVDELGRIVDSIENSDSYNWEIERFPFPWVKVPLTYLIGCPK